ncbi:MULTISPECIES: iron uptake porin [Pseudanabaena]|uniref:Carbohydrate-selective porin OprB n=2 Tax=Pseudanabaena TaxID=1152 RepID=L8N3B4_9CYAN|nr:iron uptake porin [Pseudanabaena catenata]ELS32738.1 Carbohydrate-selective porin OprB [Pseudanabaena biceps PCC 7429]MDG3495026.1 iron uptake porin [Pseudanabaena catenata USMAC16]
MKKVSLNLAGSLGLLGVIGAVAATPAFAETGVSQVSQAINNDPVAQNVTSVSQLSDVKPTDWAFTALQSLVERYGCIAGYPDRTFRGKQATSRYEFAAGLNACLDKINEIISAGLADKVSKADLATLQKLQEEFAAELATLRGRVDALDAKVAKLEAQQFSTTTKLSGSAIFSVQGASGNSGTPSNSNIFVSSRVRLDLNTSFTGSDLLKTRLEVGNGTQSIPSVFGAGSTTGTNGVSSNIGFQTYGQDYTGLTGGSTFTLAKLRYDFNLGDARISLGPVMHAYDHIDTNSFANDESADFASTFFINNPLMVLVNGQTGGAGAAIDWNIGKSSFTARALYLAGNGAQAATNGVTNGGLFGDAYQLTGELEFAPKNANGDKPFAIKLQYTNGAVNNANVNAAGVNLEWKFTKGIAVFGRYGFGTIDNRGIGATTAAYTRTLFTGTNTTTAGNLSPQTWMAGLAFPDLFKEGAMAAIAVGQPFIDSNVGNASQTNLEAFYNFPVTNNIRITPDVQFIFNPNNTSGATIFVGTLRTVFSF